MSNFEVKNRLLTVKKTSDRKHKHVVKLWDWFEMKTMKDSHDLYLKYDVLLEIIA